MSLATDNLRVLIVANDPLVRERLAALLSDQPGFVRGGQVQELSVVVGERS